MLLTPTLSTFNHSHTQSHTQCIQMQVRLCIGDTVLVHLNPNTDNSLSPRTPPQNMKQEHTTSKYEKIGVIKYIGCIEGFDMPESYVGLELVECISNGHSGIINGIKYFTSRNGHGIHTRTTNVIRKLQVSEVATKMREVIILFKQRMAEYVQALSDRDEYIQQLKKRCGDTDININIDNLDTCNLDDKKISPKMHMNSKSFSFFNSTKGDISIASMQINKSKMRQMSLDLKSPSKKSPQTFMLKTRFKKQEFADTKKRYNNNNKSGGRTFEDIRHNLTLDSTIIKDDHTIRENSINNAYEMSMSNISMIDQSNICDKSNISISSIINLKSTFEKPQSFCFTFTESPHNNDSENNSSESSISSPSDSSRKWNNNYVYNRKASTPFMEIMRAKNWQAYPMNNNDHLCVFWKCWNVGMIRRQNTLHANANNYTNCDDCNYNVFAKLINTFIYIYNNTSISESDPFVSITVHNNNDNTHKCCKTKPIIGGGQNVQWTSGDNNHMEFPINIAHDLAQYELNLNVYDYAIGPIATNRLIGTRVLDLEPLFGKPNQWFLFRILLHNEKGQYAGRIELISKFAGSILEMEILHGMYLNDLDATNNGLNVRYVLKFCVFWFIFLIISTLLFVHIEDWSFVKSFYFCMVTMSTIGYGDIVPQTVFGKILNCIILIILVCVISIVITFYMQFGLQQQALNRARFDHKMFVEKIGQNHEERNQEEESSHVLDYLAKQHYNEILINTVYLIFFIILWALLFSIFLPDEKITFWEGLEFAIVTASTIGYGNYYPHSMLGQLLCALLMFFGVILLYRLANSIANLVLITKKLHHEQKIMDRLLLSYEQFTDFDVSGDGVIDRFEFLQHALVSSRLVSQSKISMIMEKFDAIDNNGNGIIQIQDIHERQINRTHMKFNVAQTMIEEPFVF